MLAHWSSPVAQQGLVVLGSPVGTRKFVAAKLEETRVKHEALSFAEAHDAAVIQCLHGQAALRGEMGG